MCISITLRSDCSICWLLASTQFGILVLVYSGRCSGVELTLRGADSLRAHLRFGLVPCYWQHSLTSTITGGKIWFMHECVFLYMLLREDGSMQFTSKARTILAFPHKEIYKQCSLFLRVFFLLVCPMKVKSPLASIITLSLWMNAQLGDPSEEMQSCHRVVPSPFSTSLFACVLTFSIYLYELFTELWLKLNITVSR